MAGVFLTYWGLPVLCGRCGSHFLWRVFGVVSGALIAKLKIPPFSPAGHELLLKGLSLVISVRSQSISMTRPSSQHFAGFAHWLFSAQPAIPTRC